MAKNIFVKPSYQVVAHIVLNIALVILYGIFFGQQSVRKYLDKGVIITKQKDTSSSVISPSDNTVCFHNGLYCVSSFTGITIFSVNPDTGSGWKIDTNLDELEETLCRDRGTGENFLQCVEESAYTIEDIIPPNDCSQNLKVENFFMMSHSGLVKSIEDFSGKEKTELPLNGNLTYNIYLSDPSLPFITTNPRVIPRSMISLKQREGVVIQYFTVRNFQMMI